VTTIALRVPTTDHLKTPLAGGHCYILFPESTITVGELIAEKVRAEMRKARAGGHHQSSLSILLGSDITGLGPIDEMLHIGQARRRFAEGHIILSVDNVPVNDLDHVITLSKRTMLAFIPNPVPA
jgi:hypothetical protein